MSSELLATYASLGTLVDGTYYVRGEECLGQLTERVSEFFGKSVCLYHTHPHTHTTHPSTHTACVKDLIRALREDDSQCEIRRQLGRAGILKKVSEPHISR